MSTFTDDENLRRMIEKTLICYILYRTIDENRFDNISFSEYVSRLENKSLLPSILEKIHTQKIDIFKDEAPRVARIIENEFETILSLSYNAPNKALTSRMGFCNIFKHFSASNFPAPKQNPRLPTRR